MLKRKYLLLSIFILSSYSLFSQTSPLRFGVKVGGGLSDVITREVGSTFIRADYSPQLYYGLDVFGEYMVTPKLSFRAEVGLGIKSGGMKSIDPLLAYNGTNMSERNNIYDWKINYTVLSVPILAKYSIGKMYILGGPSMQSFLSSSDVERTPERTQMVSTAYRDFVQNNLPKFKLGIDFGIGYQFSKLFIEGRASFVPTSKDAYYVDIVEWNKTVGIHLGYLIK